MSPASSQGTHDATGWSRARGLSAPHEYANRHVYGKYVEYPSTSPSGLISYFGFSGMGPPPKSLGQPGDIYVDVNPQAPELYAHDVTLEWRAWSGPEVMHAHPTSNDWCLWAFATCFGWFPPKDVKADRDSRGSLDKNYMIAQALKCNNPQFCVDARADGREVVTSNSTESALTPATYPYLPPRPIVPISLKRLPQVHAFDTAERSKRAKHQDKDDEIEDLTKQVALLQQQREDREQLDLLVPGVEKKREEAAQTKLAKMHVRIEILEKELADMQDQNAKLEGNIEPRKSSEEEAIGKLPPHLLSLVEGIAVLLEESESKARDIMLLRSAATVAAEEHAAATSAAEADYAAALSAASKKAEHEKELVVKAAAELGEVAAREKEAAAREKQEIQKAAAESLEAAANNITEMHARADEEAAKRTGAERKLALYIKNVRALADSDAGDHSLFVEPLAPIQP